MSPLEQFDEKVTALYSKAAVAECARWKREALAARNLLNHSGLYILSHNPDVAHDEQMAYKQARAANAGKEGSVKP